MYLNSNTHVLDDAVTIQYMSNLGENIVRARTARDWSQGDLAKRAGVSQGTIGHLESGRNTTSRKLPEIARALGVTVEELIGGKEKPKGEEVPAHRAPPQPWPFRIQIERVLALPESKRERIEGYILALVEEHELRTAKRSA